jgi:hypothetical protein
MQLMSTRNLRRSLALGAVAVAITGAATGMVAETASAAGATLRTNDNANFPTWFWGETEICASSRSSSPKAGRFTLSAWGSPPETFWVPPAGQGSTCVKRHWWGFNVNVKNVGVPMLRVDNLNGPN